MKITSVKFVKSVVSLNELPPKVYPEVAFAGRSNVGKSSLINVLINRKGFAKTSSTPGKTQFLNFFEINNSLYFVDLPGYGYAKVPKLIKKNWRQLVEGYLSTRETLRLVLLIIDIRRDPSNDELNLFEWLCLHQLSTRVILTKIDKVSRNIWQKKVQLWQRFFKIDATPLLFSALTGEGKDKIWHEIESHVR